MTWKEVLGIVLATFIGLALAGLYQKHSEKNPTGMSTQPSDTVGCKQFRNVEIDSCKLRRDWV